MDGRTYREQTQYDGYGRAWKTRDASGGWLKQQFDARGFATRLCDSTEADTAPSCGAQFYTTVDEVDARGAVVVERRGSSVGPTVARSYDALNGRLMGVCTGPGCTVQNSAYGYDNKGQLTHREEAGRYRERFQYDGADRLTLGWFEYLGTTWYSASAPYVNPDAAAPANLSVYAQYDALGNLCRKYQFGLFAQYGYAGRAGCGIAGRPGSGSGSATLSAHQTQSLFIPGLITIANQHDLRGNMTSADSLRFYAYNALNQATEVRRVASVGSSNITIRARFAYGVDGARYRRIDDGSSAGGTTTTTIIGAVERVQKPGGAIQWRRMIGGVAIVSYSGDQLVGGLTQAAGAGTVRHQFTDRLGSVQVIGLVSGSSVTVQERLDSGADGQWRTPDPPFGRAGSAHTARGFTGHEHLEGHDTLHMNGRLYWPTGGRMVQADPVITEIHNPQNWNPYSYVLNNPLNLTDPSGYSFIDRLLNPFKSAIRSVMRALGSDVSSALIGACSFAPGAWSIACAAGASYDHARAFGASSLDARRSGVSAAFMATVAWGVKTYGGNLDMASRMAIAAGSGGVASVIQGGKFGHGFVSAGVTAAASPYVSSKGDVFGTVASAIIGGTVSEMTGGKFANGARSGAFAYVVQQGVKRGMRLHGGVTASSTSGNAVTKEHVQAVWEKLRTYAEVFEIEAEYGVLSLSFDQGKASEFLEGVININFNTFDLSYKTAMFSGYEAQIANLTGAAYWGAIDAYPDRYPFSIERILFHEAYHATQGGSGLHYQLMTERYEVPAIRATNEFMWRNFGEPYRVEDHNAVFRTRR